MLRTPTFERSLPPRLPVVNEPRAFACGRARWTTAIVKAGADFADRFSISAGSVTAGTSTAVIRAGTKPDGAPGGSPEPAIRPAGRGVSTTGITSAPTVPA
jgi:hypothetical protein